jgi:predicted transcriptional regulator
VTYDLQRLRAKDVMHEDVQWTTAGESLRTAGERMCKRGMRALLQPQ